MSQKGKDRPATTGEKDGGEPRHDDLLWKDLLARFFVPMLRSVLPDLARDIDDKRDVVFLDKELRRLARFTRRHTNISFYFQNHQNITSTIVQ